MNPYNLDPNLWHGLLHAFLWILTATVSNMGATLVPKLLSHLGAPNAPISRKHLGANKTWLGFLGGTTLGTFVGALGNTITPHDTPIWIYLLIAAGALVGDMIESAYKRTQNIPPGEPLPFWDYADYLIGAAPGIALALAGAPQESRGYALGSALLLALLCINHLHSAVNLLAFHLGIKKVPY